MTSNTLLNRNFQKCWSICQHQAFLFKLVLILSTSFLAVLQLNAQVVINEIQAGGTVELKNTGTSNIEVADYWLCDFPSYRSINQLNITVGDTDLAPGEILVVDNFNFIDGNDGELGLYNTNSFGSSNAIVDYVEWGSSGHGRSGVAAAAGIWTEGDVAQTFTDVQSLAYSGSGNSSDSWSATDNPTIGAENGTDGGDCDIVTNDISLTGGSTSTSICVDGNADPLEVTTNGGTPDASTGWIITDDIGNILAIPAAPPFDLDGAGIGVCQIWYIRYEADSGFGGNEMGNHLDDLTGCFDLSNPIEVIREAPDGGMVNLIDGSTTYEGTAGNIVIEVQHTTASPNLSYWYIITDDNDNILAFANSAETNTLDLSGAPAGECHVWGWSYRGLDDPMMGENISTLTDDDCEAISDNFITVIRNEDTGGDSADLSLEISADTDFYEQYENVSYTLTVKNDGAATATNIAIAAGLPDGMVHSSNSVSAGQYSLFFEQWNIASLESGESATLELRLFTLIDNEPITNFVQIIALDQSDNDSAPNNNETLTPNEDDEAAITIQPLNGGGEGNGEGDIDLELNIEADGSTYTIYEHVTYTLTLSNNGPDEASNVVVEAPLPEGMVFSDAIASSGDYSLFFERWEVSSLAPNETAVLELTLFPLVSGGSLTNFVQVHAASQSDIDSTPANNDGNEPNEDDEAAITLSSTTSLSENNPVTALARPVLEMNRIYPIPALYEVNVDIFSRKEMETTLQIFSVDGQEILQQKVNLIEGNNQFQFDTSDWNMGNYFIVVQGLNSKRYQKQILKITD